MAELAKAYFGGGCFWCTEAVFQRLKGVKEVVSGYSGGASTNPTYKEICTGLSGHAEVVEITYDSSQIDFKTLLEVFWTAHDPTTLNRQGNDRGTQYRSVIYYTKESEKESAERSISEVAKLLYSDPIVTEISPLKAFYPAEQNHQNFYNRNGFHGYCMVVINPKVKKLKRLHSSLLKEE